MNFFLSCRERGGGLGIKLLPNHIGNRCFDNTINGSVETEHKVKPQCRFFDD